MKRFVLVSLLVVGVSLITFAQALPGQNNGRISRAGGGKPGGSPPQVEFNNGGSFGGVGNVTSDGVHEIDLTEQTIPSAPGSGVMQFVWSPDGGAPFPLEMSAYWGIPMPKGLLGQFGLMSGGGWEVTCSTANGFGNSGFTVGYNPIGVSPFISQNGSITALPWSSGSLIGRQRANKFSESTGAQNIVTGPIYTGALHMWRGNTAGAGGFMFWTRFAIDTMGAVAQGTGIMAGVTGSTVAPTVVWLSNLPNVFFIGANRGDTVLSVCSDDNGGAGVCTQLVGSTGTMPFYVNGAMYDVWIYTPPNANRIDYCVHRMDVENWACGSVFTPLPQNTVQLTWTVSMVSGDGGQATSFDWVASCAVYNL